MVNLQDILNKRYSTRNLDDQVFEQCLPALAQQLEQHNFTHNYSHSELWKDWTNLCKWTTVSNSINSTNRVGMKLCEHFFPNFFDIENARGQSFAKLWQADNLEKILRWNRKSHSTPYMSEIRRGIYFCCGLTKNTMYRPQMMKLACIKYQPEVVLDPCAGWGGRMLGAVAAGARYIAFEPNTTTYANLQNLANYLGIQNQVTLICDDARNMGSYNLPTVDMVLTSPPYFDLEVYTHEDTQSLNNTDSYQDWVTKFLEPVIELGLRQLKPGGVSCWNVGKVRNQDMNDDVKKIHVQNSFKVVNTLSVNSSKRQSNQNATKNQKNSDDTVVYQKA